MSNNRILALLVSAAAVVTWTFLDAADIRGAAIVQDDASLRLSGHRVRLFGAYIPALNRSCGNSVQPLSCEEQRAARALNFRLSGFVHCNVRRKYSNGDLLAVCWNDRIDLGAYLIERGLALATPEAPFEYHAQERVARSQRRGLWTFYGRGDY
ncbi:MAG: thermonuclease family protein [Gammaproteobacteria bacterium]